MGHASHIREGESQGTNGPRAKGENNHCQSHARDAVSHESRDENMMSDDAKEYICLIEWSHPGGVRHMQRYASMGVSPHRVAEHVVADLSSIDRMTPGMTIPRLEVFEAPILVCTVKHKNQPLLKLDKLYFRGEKARGMDAG
jgi:hypothetical protein